MFPAHYTEQFHTLEHACLALGERQCNVEHVVSALAPIPHLGSFLKLIFSLLSSAHQFAD